MWVPFIIFFKGGPKLALNLAYAAYNLEYHHDTLPRDMFLDWGVNEGIVFWGAPPLEILEGKKRTKFGAM